MSLKTSIDSLIENVNAFIGQLNSLTVAVQQALGYKDSAAASAALAAQVVHGDAIATSRYHISAINHTFPALAFVASDFVDHAFDSDGGAWIRKCQGKSWYTEARTLGKQWGNYATATAATAAGAVVGDFYYNTTNSRFEELTSGTTSAVTYRAGKAEMPMRVLPTVEAARLILWDCDGAVPTMWMVFIATNAVSILGWAATQTLTSVSVAGAILVIGGDRGVTTFDFAADKATIYYHTGGYQLSSDRRISARNSAASVTAAGAAMVANNSVNSVATTVLPDAPVNESGLPVPTIYAFTAGGVSRIAHDGTVSSTATGSSVTRGCISGDYVMADRLSGAYVSLYSKLSALPTGGAGNLGAYWGTFTASAYGATQIPSKLGAASTGMRLAPNAIGFASAGLSIVLPNPTTGGLSGIADITSTYNTGWMVGDIRRAFLANSKTADRSVKAATLTEVGTITDTVNAGGRNVYSGFSASNYLQEASHADWNALGTGDFSIVMSGVKWGASGTNRTLFCWGDGASAGSVKLLARTTNYLEFWIYDASFAARVSSSTIAFSDTAEHTLEIKRSTVSGVANTLQILVDGVVVGSAVSALTVSNATANLVIGYNLPATTDAWAGGQVACVRISATAPTAEQSKFIAATENALNGGAACLLSNSSSVSALRRDAQTGVLLVGDGTNVDTFGANDLVLKRIASEAHGTTTLATIAAGSGVRFFGGSAGGKAQAAARDINAELQASQLGLAQAQQRPVFKQIASDGAGKLSFPQGFKPTRVTSTAGTYVSLATSAPAYDGSVWSITGLTASTNYDCEIVRVLP